MNLFKFYKFLLKTIAFLFQYLIFLFLVKNLLNN